MRDTIHRRKTAWPILLTVLATLCLALPGPARAADELGSFIEGLAGGWVADSIETPRGPMPFALLFERKDDGTLAAHTPWDRETFVDLAFRRASDGRWVLAEHARLPEAGDQWSILVPAGVAAGARRFVDAADSGRLAVDLAVREDIMEITVWVRGKRHVHGVLRRVPPEALPGLRERLAALGSRPHEPFGREGRP